MAEITTASTACLLPERPAVIAIAPRANTPGVNPRTGKPWRDASGAFQIEARAFARLHRGRYVTFDNLAPQAERFADVIDLLTGRRADVVAFFMHGYRTGLQCGVTLRNVHVLAATLRDCGAKVVPLMACDAARDADRDRKDDMEDGPGGAGGFASVLARSGFQIDAHANPQHATKNPNVRRFLPDDGTDAGEWLVEPGSEHWRAWCRALQEDQGFRLSFPLWSRERVVAELAARAAAA